MIVHLRSIPYRRSPSGECEEGEESCGGRVCRGNLHIRKAFIRRLILDDSELRNFFISVKDEATIDALWI